jgi:hypothetical protein
MKCGCGLAIGPAGECEQCGTKGPRHRAKTGRAARRIPNEPPDLPHPADQAPEPEPWEEPVPLGTRAPLPPFPVSTLPEYMANMAAAVATEVQVPPDLPAALAMGVLSTAAGGRAEVLVRGRWREPLNLYQAVAMPPGAGKSPAFRLMSSPVFAAEQHLRKNARDTILAAEIARESAMAEADKRRRDAKSDAELKEAIKAASLAESLTVPAMPRLTADDVVPEQAATLMAEQGGRLAILSAEGTFFSVIMGRYSSGTPNLELVLKAHAGDRVQVDRRGRSELIERPALTILTTVQPAVLRDMAAKPALRERGVLARFLLSLPHDIVGTRNITPDLVPDDIADRYMEQTARVITSLAAWTDPAVILLSPGALKLHTEFRAELEPRLKSGAGDLEALRDWASKLPGATARIAGLLHRGDAAARGPRSSVTPDRGPRSWVTEETMARAITQARYWVDHAMAAFGAMRAHPALDDARSVLDWIGDRTTFSERDVYRAMHRRFPTSAQAAPALSVLEDHGYIRRTPAPRRPGRRTANYEVYPRR